MAPAPPTARRLTRTTAWACPPAKPAYTLRRLWLTDEEQDGYYYGFANEGLWPLCHIAFVRPIFRESDWRYYRSVNEKFAEAVVAEAKRPDPIVLIQDYHLALAPRMIRDRLPNATIITFWHIPWPNSETFSICPWKEEIIDGLLGSSILGFHTQFPLQQLHRDRRPLHGEPHRPRARLDLARRPRDLRAPYPISIDWPPAALVGQKPVPETRVAVCARGSGCRRTSSSGSASSASTTPRAFSTGCAASTPSSPRIRTGPGASASRRWRRQTRSKLASYKTLQADAEALRRRHSTPATAATGVEPITLLARHHEPDEVFELFRGGGPCASSPPCTTA